MTLRKHFVCVRATVFSVNSDLICTYAICIQQILHSFLYLHYYILYRHVQFVYNTSRMCILFFCFIIVNNEPGVMHELTCIIGHSYAVALTVL